MKLQGKVLKNFRDKESGKLYEAQDEYKEADVFVAEKTRYQLLEKKGFVEKGSLYTKETKESKEKKEEN